MQQLVNAQTLSAQRDRVTTKMVTRGSKDHTGIFELSAWFFNPRAPNLCSIVKLSLIWLLKNPQKTQNCHSRESGNPRFPCIFRMPTIAGMTWKEFFSILLDATSKRLKALLRALNQCLLFCETRTETILISGVGCSCLAGELQILSTTSSPFTTCPNTVCLPSSQGVSI